LDQPIAGQAMLALAAHAPSAIQAVAGSSSMTRTRIERPRGPTVPRLSGVGDEWLCPDNR
jgi:hypothetical protein